MFPNGEATTVDSVMAMLTCEDWLDRKKKEDPTARMVINMSYGDPGVSSVERNVAKKMNERGDILMVASSGNNQLDYPFKLFYPACKRIPYIYCCPMSFLFVIYIRIQIAFA